MDLEQLMAGIPAWLSAIGLLVAACSAIAALTPTPKDDAFFAKIYRIIDLLALNVGFAKDKPKPPTGFDRNTTASLLLLILLLPALGACASYKAQQLDATPAQTVFALQSDFTAALPPISAFMTSGRGSAEVRAELARLVTAAADALDAAEFAVRDGRSALAPALISVAQAAVERLKLYWAEQKPQPGGAAAASLDLTWRPRLNLPPYYMTVGVQHV